ncbi:MAG TPA: hypothetical protein VMS56_13160 [Thermoanaerobaculia bacterium]|nr:hypothetical protein [Thermoanaerobaculia bacterium]
MDPARRPLIALLLSALVLTLLVSASRRRPSRPEPQHLDINRSFAVTDTVILDGFSFERVMNTLVERSGVRGMSATMLYQQWFDTQNPKPGLVSADSPHCDDFLTDGKPSFNNFPRRCPTPEGALAITNPFVPPSYIPLALINRFDMTPADGSNCGQYRVIFAKTDNIAPLDRVHLIFEAALPNPDPSTGLAGCKPVAQFWAELSSIDSIAERRARLENFFFTGISGFAPVIHPDHLSRAAGGSVRSLHYTSGARVGPRFYQFRLEKTCSSSACSLTMQPDVLENTITGRLFDGNNQTPIAQRFRKEFLRQVESLSIRDVNGYFMNIPSEYLLAESDPGSGEYALFYGIAFTVGRFSAEGRKFHEDIQAELNRIGSPLKPLDLVSRAETQTCVGCHFVAGPIGAGEVFPRSLFGFEHLSEIIREPGEAGPRFSISPAMRDVFIPHRMEILRQFLSAGTAPVHSNSPDDDATTANQITLGGGRLVH